MSSSSKNVTKYRRKRKQNLVNIAGGSCVLCGYNKCTRALEFHHLNPEEKDFSFSKTGDCRDLEKDIAELRKCILVCSNCHCEIHEGFYSKEELEQKQIINEEVIEALRKEKEELYKKKNK